MVLVSLREQGRRRGSSNAAKSPRWAGLVPGAGGRGSERTMWLWRGQDALVVGVWDESCAVNTR